MTHPPADGTGAILLAGGRATRMGGVTKPLLEVGGDALLHHAVAAVQGCAPVTVVAEVLDAGLDVDWVREDPPFAGPAAAVVVALTAWDARGVVPRQAFLLACDLSHPDAAVAALRAAEIPADADGACLVDGAGRPQWLAGLYRAEALRRAAASLPDAGRDASLRALLARLTLVHVPAATEIVHDIDTWQDLEEARTRAGRLEHP
ncbi:MAG: molybdenum cofactor guanylyltransferase [Protaetiibacter sp.]